MLKRQATGESSKATNIAATTARRIEESGLELGVEVGLFGGGERLVEAALVLLGEGFGEAVGDAGADPDLDGPPARSAYGLEATVAADENAVGRDCDRLEPAGSETLRCELRVRLLCPFARTSVESTWWARLVPTFRTTYDPWVDIYVENVAEGGPATYRAGRLSPRHDHHS